MRAARLAGGRLSLVLVGGRGQGAGTKSPTPAQTVPGTQPRRSGPEAPPGSRSYYHFSCRFRGPQPPLLWATGL